MRVRSTIAGESEEAQRDAGGRVSSLTPDQYIEAKRYLRLLANSITALKDRNGPVTSTDRPKSKNVAELVKFMAEKGCGLRRRRRATSRLIWRYIRPSTAFDAGIPHRDLAEVVRQPLFQPDA